MRKWEIHSIVRHSVWVVLLCWGVGARAEEQKPLRMMAYNVENLFDVRHDSLHADEDFLPEGAYHWTYGRLLTKLSHIAQVIAAAGEWQAPALVGLVEVENDSCLWRLCRYHLRRRHYPYKHLLLEGQDRRGIDPALLYDSTRLALLAAEAVRIPLPAGEAPTRDILHATFALLPDSARITLHCFVCHFPSQRGGAAATAEKRALAFATLAQAIAPILEADSAARILVMGDFNTSPKENLLPMHNLMLPFIQRAEGTHKYQDRWDCLDQMYASPGLCMELTEPRIFAPQWLLEDDNRYLGYKPFRTYSGPRYLGGYSDHLPVLIDWMPYGHE